MLSSLFLNRDGSFTRRVFEAKEYKKTKKRITTLTTRYWGIVENYKTYPIADLDKPMPVADMYNSSQVAGYAIVSETMSFEVMAPLLIEPVKALLQNDVSRAENKLSEFVQKTK